MSLVEKVAELKDDGLDIKAQNHWEVFGMKDIAEKGTALGEHEINKLFRKFALRFAPDKKALRNWSEEDENLALSYFKHVCNMRDLILQETKKLPIHMKSRSDRKPSVDKFKWLEFPDYMRSTIRTLCKGALLRLNTSNTQQNPAVDTEEMEETTNLLHYLESNRCKDFLDATGRPIAMALPSYRDIFENLFAILTQERLKLNDSVSIHAVISHETDTSIPRTAWELLSHQFKAKRWEQFIQKITIIEQPSWVIETHANGPNCSTHRLMVVHISTRVKVDTSFDMHSISIGTQLQTKIAFYKLNVAYAEDDQAQAEAILLKIQDIAPKSINIDDRAAQKGQKYNLHFCKTIAIRTKDDNSHDAVVKQVVQNLSQAMTDKICTWWDDSLLQDMTGYKANTTHFTAWKHLTRIATQIAPIRGGILFASEASSSILAELLSNTRESDAIITRISSRDDRVVATPPLLQREIATKIQRLSDKSRVTLPNGDKAGPPPISILSLRGLNGPKLKSMPEDVLSDIMTAIKDSLPHDEDLGIAAIWVTSHGKDIPRDSYVLAPVSLQRGQVEGTVDWMGKLEVHNPHKSTHQKIADMLHGKNIQILTRICTIETSDNQGWDLSRTETKKSSKAIKNSGN